MNFATLTAFDLADRWFAMCPKCSHLYGPEEFRCPNCEGRMLFFRETHVGRGVRCVWTECGFICPKDGIKLKSFTCDNHYPEPDALITVPLVTAYLPFAGARKQKWYAGIAAFFISLSVSSNSFAVMRMNEKVSLVLSYAVAVASTAAAVKAVKTKRWLWHER